MEDPIVFMFKAFAFAILTLGVVASVAAIIMLIKSLFKE